VDEFEAIARLFGPLAAGAPEALGLADDAALIPARPGFDLVVSKDAVVAGVHFLPDDPPELVAQKLLRQNLSDLAAKGAEPYGYLLACAWPHGVPDAARAAFAAGLAEDQARFGIKLFGGDTVSTDGPFTACVTALGWVPSGTMVRRSGAKPGQVLLATGTIGDGGLGLLAARGELPGLSAEHRAALLARYRLPEPRLALAAALRAHAGACLDISDGLVADAVHLEEASGVAVQLDLERLPLSVAAKAWLAARSDPAQGLAWLATAGDDYELLIAADPAAALPLAVAAASAGVALTPVGRVHEGQGTLVLHRGAPVILERIGWRHG
jgi:thiamine-monophosphate kinase